MRKYTELKYNLKTLSFLNACCMYDVGKTKVNTMYSDYRNFRLWFVDQMIEHEIDFTSLPVLTDKSIKNTIEFCTGKINMVSFKNIKSHEFEIDYVNDKVVALD
ncbi:MAG: hypothetical protein ACI9IA_000203 [Enterobacterales bacterium]|jgi:hypothetical protein